MKAQSPNPTVKFALRAGTALTRSPLPSRYALRKAKKTFMFIRLYVAVRVLLAVAGTLWMNLGHCQQRKNVKSY